MATVIIPEISPESYSIATITEPIIAVKQPGYLPSDLELEDSPFPNSKLTETDRIGLEELAYHYGHAPESYDLASSPGSIWRSTCHSAAMSVIPDGRYWHIPGGIIAAPDNKARLIELIKQQAIKHKKLIAVYSVLKEELPYFMNAGFVVNKFGEEPVVELKDLSWQGKEYEWVRRQTNYCERQGLEFREVSDAEQVRLIADELLDILNQDLKSRIYSRPLKLLEGIFDPYLFHRRRLFIAQQKTTEVIEGFVACSPLLGGQEWALETYRKLPTAPRGTTPFLFRKVMDQLKNEGVSRVSLCLIPGKGVELDRSKHTDRYLKFVLGVWYHRLNFLFNLQGQDYFKSRFRPTYRERYLCVYPQNTLLSMLSFVKTTGALCPNLTNIFKCSMNSLWRSTRG